MLTKCYELVCSWAIESFTNSCTLLRKQIARKTIAKVQAVNSEVIHADWTLLYGLLEDGRRVERKTAKCGEHDDDGAWIKKKAADP